jgi:sortase A
MVLGISALFSCLFVGLAIVYRLQVGPGMGAAPEVIAGRNGLPTLVPTFTPVATGMPSTPFVPALPPADISAPQAGATAAAPAPTAPPDRPPATSPPTRLVIPSINLDIPILSVGTKTTQSGGQIRTVWADVPNAGAFHETSAYPGNPGNTVINGHRDILGAVFRHLDRVVVGDKITLYVGDVAYPYQVVEILVVPEVFASASQRAENQRLIGYMPEERLTLITCTPVVLATHRLLVIAWPAAP